MSGARAWESMPLPEKWAPPVGAFSPAAAAAGLVFVSGQVPRDPVSGQWEKDRSFEEQVRRVFRNMEATLQAAGAELSDVLNVTIFLADIKHWSAMNTLYREFFRPPFPARTIVGAQLEGFLVEANAVAVKPAKRSADA